MRRGNRWVMAAVGAFAALGLTACGEVEDVLASLGLGGEEAGIPDDVFTSGEVLLEAVDDPGPNPFTDRVSPEPDDTLLTFAAQGAPIPADEELAADQVDPSEALVQQDGHLTIDGATPGLYGGTNQAGACDPDQLAAFLDAEPDKAEAWAGVLGIDADAIPELLDSLTPVNLGADTRVLNHGFADGQATPREAVLQRATAVLVDRNGVPRVKCECGNPLLEPTVEPDEVYEGEPWETFREDVVILIEPSEEELEEIEITDIETGERIRRPSGSRGEQDEPARPRRDTTPTQVDDAHCGTVERATGDVFELVVHEGEVDCAEVQKVVGTYVQESLGSSVEIAGWSCNPASAGMAAEGIAAECLTDDVVVHVMFDQDDPPVAAGDPDATTEDEVDDSIAGEQTDCGTLSGDIGMLDDATAETDIGLIVRGAESCEVAEEVATAFLLEFGEHLVSDGSLPYEAGVLGWECTSGPFLGGDPGGTFGCVLHNAEIELTPPG